MKKCKHCNTEHNLRGHSCRVCKDGLYRYNMTRNDILALHEAQNCKCALCEKDLEMFVGRSGGFIDHCHTTGKVRSILCNRCNTIVGGLENTEVPLERLLNYLGVAQSG